MKVYGVFKWSLDDGVCNEQEQELRMPWKMIDERQCIMCMSGINSDVCPSMLGCLWGTNLPLDIHDVGEDPQGSCNALQWLRIMVPVTALRHNEE